MQQYDIHVCLISAQAAPNLLPILDSNFKPKNAIFLVSKKMKNQANFLLNAFQQKSVNVTIEELNDEFDFESMEQQMIDLFSRYENENIALNVTGGTKLMSIAAASVFNLIEKPIFYIDTDKNRIVFISKDANNQSLPNLGINAKNTLNIYLSAYGASILKKADSISNKDWLEVAKFFIKKYNKYQNDIPLLNGYATQSRNSGEKNNFKITLEKNHTKINSLLDLFEQLKYKFNIIDFYDYNIEFRNKETKEFLNGGWLEEYTYQQIQEIKGIDDIALNLEIGNSHYNQNKNIYDKSNLGNHNELDIVFIAKNKLHIIECKTQKMDSKNTKPEEILYKLETLKDYGGLMTKKCLVSYLPVTPSVSNRAKELNIKIIQGEDLKRLKEILQDWIAK